MLAPVSIETAPLVLGRDALDQLFGSRSGFGVLGDQLAVALLVGVLGR